jgi:hypothetical protein
MASRGNQVESLAGEHAWITPTSIPGGGPYWRPVGEAWWGSQGDMFEWTPASVPGGGPFRRPVGEARWGSQRWTCLG